MFNSQQKFFNETGVNLFRNTEECRDIPLTKRLAIFDRDKE